MMVSLRLVDLKYLILLPNAPFEASLKIRHDFLQQHQNYFLVIFRVALVTFNHYYGNSALKQSPLQSPLSKIPTLVYSYLINPAHFYFYWL